VQEVTMSNDPQNQDSLGEKLNATFDDTNSDKDYNALKALLSSIPSVGPLGVSLWESRNPPPIMKRLHIFLGDLVREFEKLKSKVELVDFESAAFQTTLIYVFQIVIRTHQEQKLKALRNIVLNSAIPRDLDDDILTMFLNWVNIFTEGHITTLKHLHYIETYTLEQFQAQFPLLEKNRFIYNKLLGDLADHGLISLKESYFTMEDDGRSPTLRSRLSEIPQDMYNKNIYPKHPQQIEENEVQMKTFKYREDIDALLREHIFSSQTSKTTELGKQFIGFIEYPSI
jgi:hypothetical protein